MLLYTLEFRFLFGDKMKKGDKVLVQVVKGRDLWVHGEIVGFTPKRIKCLTLHNHITQNYAPNNVKARVE
jgi:hypothetical protein